MEIISAMKVLIIFFIVLTIIFLCFIFLKVKIHIRIVVDNLKIYVKVRVFKKEFKGKFVLRKKEIRRSGDDSNKLKKAIRLKNDNENKLSLVKNIAEVIEIHNLELNVLIGTPFVFLTILASQVINILIPFCLNLPFKEKKNINYKTLASYKDFELKANLDVVISITLYELFLIFLKYFTLKEKGK